MKSLFCQIRVATRHTAYAVLFGLLVFTPQRMATGQMMRDHNLFVVANAQFTLCHELTHALISAMDIPIIGQEENAADQLAAICFLHPKERGRQDPEAAEKLIAVADAWKLEWELDKGAEATPYWDVHALDIQRYYHILCLLYGSDPQQFAHLPEQLGLPWERAWSCEGHEYSQAVKAGQWLLQTYGIRNNGSENQNSGNVHVVYESPSTASKADALRIIQTSALFENKAALINSLFALPHETTAYWHQERREIVFCYDLLERFGYLAKLRQCVLGDRTGPSNGWPIDRGRIENCQGMNQ